MFRPTTAPTANRRADRMARAFETLAVLATLAACEGGDPLSETGEPRDAQDASADASSADPEDRADASDAATSDAEAPASDASTGDPPGASAELTFASDVEPVRSTEEALDRVFIPPFDDCRQKPDGDEVCTPVAISGCTEPGLYFPDYADCEVVRRQRPYWSAPPAGVAADDDPRLSDATYMQELAWVRDQIAASGCTCCHDSDEVAPSQWDIRAEPVWIDSLSDAGLALFAGHADSDVLGAYPPEEAFGFSRDQTGVPTTDPERMQRFMDAELERRGLSVTWAKEVAPFGGPIYQNSIQEPTTCTAEQGVDAANVVHWTGGPARYVYVQREDAENPGVPPNLDLPEGTLWRLDVRASDPALQSGVPYGTTPPGSFQSWPTGERAPSLQQGTRYKLVVLQDVGLPLVNCHFLPGETAESPIEAPDDGGTTDAGTPSDAGGSGDADGQVPDDGGNATCASSAFGTPCDTSAECTCEAAPYCAKSPFDPQGYCTATVESCDGDTSACPEGWGCFDVSVFAPGEPVICSRP